MNAVRSNVASLSKLFDLRREFIDLLLNGCKYACNAIWCVCGGGGAGVVNAAVEDASRHTSDINSESRRAPFGTDSLYV